jgi:hypothetical protein
LDLRQRPVPLSAVRYITPSVRAGLPPPPPTSASAACDGAFGAQVLFAPVSQKVCPRRDGGISRAALGSLHQATQYGGCCFGSQLGSGTMLVPKASSYQPQPVNPSLKLPHLGLSPSWVLVKAYYLLNAIAAPGARAGSKVLSW